MGDIKDILKDMDYGTAPESDKAVRDWLARHKAEFGHFINGKFTAPKDEDRLSVINPASEETLGQIPSASTKTVDQAVKAAARAFKKWSELSGYARSKYLYAMARQIQKRSRFLAVLESLDNGKPIRESRDNDIPLVARHFYHHAGWARICESEFPGHQPVGVCGQIIPWNFPLLMLAWKIAPALAAGNTLVLKPADLTPLTAMAFAEICSDIGLPPGVVNIVHGGAETGACIVNHPDIAKIAFTGSTDVGRLIRRETAGSGKKLSLELGGKSAFMVFDDADLDAAVEGVVDAIWFNQGEVCCAGSRILVHEAVEKRFTAKLTRRMASLRVGDPLDKSTDVGAIVSGPQAQRITSLIDQAKSEGARLLEAPGDMPGKGHFVRPGILCDVDPSHMICQTEIFGPIGTLTPFRSAKEAVQLANNSRYGLSASIWSENISLALEVAAAVKAGVVWINATNLFDAAAGFGGMRESGFGREGGREGMAEYLRPVQRIGKAKARKAAKTAVSAMSSAIDMTPKNYIGGKQARPDNGMVLAVNGAGGTLIGQVAASSRKDVRNAVEAAAKASSWTASNGHTKAQILYYLAENLDQRASEFAQLIRQSTGCTGKEAAHEVETCLSRIFYYAALADKFDGQVHNTNARHVTLAMPEPFGVLGIACPDQQPLLSFLSLVLPAVAMGNRVVALTSQAHPLPAIKLTQVLETSDMPAGVINILTGETAETALTLASHDEVAALWDFRPNADRSKIEEASAGNLKPVWSENGDHINWVDPACGEGRAYLASASQIKNIWIPYGV